MSGVVMWFTGPPSSGKSTLALAVQQALRKSGRTCLLLDGDAVRAALTPTPGYSVQGRRDFYRTLAQLAALVAEQGAVVLVAATAHRRFYRAYARRRAPRFIEVFVDTPVAECRKRNSKGLYGQVAALPGDALRYERPRHADVKARGGSSERAVRACLAALGSPAAAPNATRLATV